MVLLQVIQTKYFGPSNVKGARIKATASAGSITIGYDHALTLRNNHYDVTRPQWAQDQEVHRLCDSFEEAKQVVDERFAPL